MTSLSPIEDNELRDEIQMWVEVAVHKFNAAEGVVVLGECSKESVDAIVQLFHKALEAREQQVRLDELNLTFGKPTEYDDFYSVPAGYVKKRRAELELLNTNHKDSQE